MGLQPPKLPKLVIFGINVPNRGIPLKRFLQYLAFGWESQVRTLIPNFTVLALKCGPTAPKVAIFDINLPIWENFGSPQTSTTTNLPLCNDTITVLKITPLHSVSIITNFVIPKRDKKNNKTNKKITLFRLQPVRDPRLPPYLAW